MSERFVHLHCLSCYSLGSGATDLPTLFEAAKGQGMPTLAITDTNGLHGAVFAQKIADEIGVRPLIGAVVDEADPVAWPSSRYAVLLTRDAIGYAEIARTVTDRRMTPADFSLPTAVAALSDHVVVISPDAATLEAVRLAGSGAHRCVELTNCCDAAARVSAISYDWPAVSICRRWPPTGSTLPIYPASRSTVSSQPSGKHDPAHPPG